MRQCARCTHRSYGSISRPTRSRRLQLPLAAPARRRGGHGSASRAELNRLTVQLRHGSFRLYSGYLSRRHIAGFWWAQGAHLGAELDAAGSTVLGSLPAGLAPCWARSLLGRARGRMQRESGKGGAGWAARSSAALARPARVGEVEATLSGGVPRRRPGSPGRRRSSGSVGRRQHTTRQRKSTGYLRNQPPRTLTVSSEITRPQQPPEKNKNENE